jgi:hypothetical protein
MTYKIIPKLCASHRCLDDVKSDMYRDDTELTHGSDFDDCYDALDGEMSKVTVGTSDTLEESLESSFMELQHEVREKTSQCTILRETLTTMSAIMRRMEFQLKEKVTELEEKMSLCEQKTSECEHWKNLYESLELKIKNGISDSEIQPAVSTVVDNYMLAHYNYESYTNRRPWRRNKNGTDDNWDELSASSDSIDEQNCSDFDTVDIKRKKVSKRKTNSKRKNIVKPMETNEFVINHETLEDTKQEQSKAVAQVQIHGTKNIIAPESTPYETNGTQPEATPYDIEYVPPELNNLKGEEEEQNEIENLLNSSWGNFEHCFSEVDPLHHPQCDDFLVAGLPSDNVVINKSETAPVRVNSHFCVVDDERRARRLRRRVIRTAKRAARKAQFQCEVVEC